MDVDVWSGGQSRKAARMQARVLQSLERLTLQLAAMDKKVDAVLAALGVEPEDPREKKVGQ